MKAPCGCQEAGRNNSLALLFWREKIDKLYESLNTAFKDSNVIKS